MTDLALRFLRDGYGAVELDRRSRDGRHSYVSRLMGRRAVVVCGESGARLFYDEEVVQRGGAMPPALAWLLFGRGAVHGLDGEPHRRRKQLFLDQLGPDQVQACAELAGADLRDLLTGSVGREVGLFSELVSVYGRAVIAWAGIDVTRGEAERLSRQLAAIVDGFGFSGAAYARAWRARLGANAWGRRLIDDVRGGRVVARERSVLQVLAASGLDPHTASVELGNVLRRRSAVRRRSRRRWPDGCGETRPTGTWRCAAAIGWSWTSWGPTWIRGSIRTRTCSVPSGSWATRRVRSSWCHRVGVHRQGTAARVSQ
jgi:fatty-acid peroxygenase